MKIYEQLLEVINNQKLRIDDLEKQVFKPTVDHDSAHSLDAAEGWALFYLRQSEKFERELLELKRKIRPLQGLIADL